MWVSDPRRIAALAIESDDGPRAIVVNLTGEPTPFLLNGEEQPELRALRGAFLRRLAASS